MKKSQAITILLDCNIPYFGTMLDFHTLTSDQVYNLLAWAVACKYKKPKYANGSKARYFYSYLCRKLK